jgi:D-beta-D-heptose 7-phosphate kinase/D-beta-D-heptose 1-phosphate adenosyltransferase
MSADLLPVLSRLAGVRVLCVGDIMLDRYVYGQVSRISPEAPIPVFATDYERLVLGGAGNVARNIVALGGVCDLVTLTGRDATAAQIRELAGHEHERLRLHSITDPSRRTPLKIRHIAGGQQLLRADEETTTPPDATITARLIEQALALLPDAGAVILSDYGKGALATAVCRALIPAARTHNIPLFVDPKGDDYGLYAGAAIVTPNRKELEAAARLPAATDSEVARAGRRLIAAHGFDAVVATRSEKGMSVITEATAEHLPTEAIEVYDVSGAGDTVVATLALATAAGASLQDAARLANCAAGVVVGKRGTATASLAEIRLALRRRTGFRQEAKIFDVPTLQDLLPVWRAEGLKIGFTNGCFDVLHAGHVALLTEARRTCDRLVVGVNSDASVQRLKGPTRPVHGEYLRTFVLAALEAVDAVVLFPEETPRNLIAAIRPDVLMKGADYTIDTVVGADIVQAYDGEVKLIPLVPGLSTTGILNHGQHSVSSPRNAPAAGHA